MKKIKVVIGKNFGDEGKGAVVNSLCKEEKTIVIRHNGGAQAGHTVEEGLFRFVFHQLGSGTLKGVPTYWANTFIPDLFKLEEEIKGFLMEKNKLTHEKVMENYFFMSQKPVIFASPECFCTLIFDVLLNSLIEEVRSDKKHGSCGMGIFESLLRNKNESFCFRLKDLQCYEIQDIIEKLRHIRDDYTLPRIECLKKECTENIRKFEESQWMSLILDDVLLCNVAKDMFLNFHNYIKLQEWDNIKENYQIFLFENAQGLMLDKHNMDYFPHLTPSNTGLYNIAKLFRSDDDKYEVEVIYVTRTYVTRHGAGRLDFECEKNEISSIIVDKTNIPNCWQDSLRFAKHPEGSMFWKYIKNDLDNIKDLNCFCFISIKIQVNHLDETNGKVIFSNSEMELEQFGKFCRENGNVQMICI